MSSSAETEFTATVDKILGEWGQPFCDTRTELTDALERLYRAELEFPPGWPEQRRETFICNQADLDAGELSTQFDDLIDTVTNEFGLRYGTLPHSEDAADLIDTARTDAVAEFVDRQLSCEIPNAIEDAEADDPTDAEGPDPA